MAKKTSVELQRRHARNRARLQRRGVELAEAGYVLQRARMLHEKAYADLLVTEDAIVNSGGTVGAGR